jgi:beta-phosphoglucomutase
LKLLNGLNDFVEDAYQKGIKMAIGTAAITSNVDFVLDGLHIRKYFPVAISADDVRRSKPDPETFVLAAEKLEVKPENCIVFEDNPKGVEAALNGGMKAVVITTMHTKNEFDGLPNILKFIDDYTDPFLKTLLIS